MRSVLLKSLLLLALVASAALVIADEPAETGAETTETETTETADPNAETFTFQAEVNRLMDIIINSLYSNRDIFLRELISNASDALDKLRFASLTDKSVLGEGDQAKLEVRVSYDKDAKTLTVRDTGVGMTKQDLINHLGVVASSGTTQFLDAAKNGKDAVSLIGQFGVGFYSVYLVADEVVVTSKHNDDKQHIWRSRADSTFTIAEDPQGDTLGRGTAITLHLKDDASEYLEEATLKRIVEKYSQFINFPIYLHVSKNVEKEVPVDDDEEADEAAADAAADEVADDVPVDDGTENLSEEEKEQLKELEEQIKAREQPADDDEPVPEDTGDDDEQLDVSDEDEDEKEKKPKTKTITEQVWEWEQLNSDKAIWLRPPSEVTDEEYDQFYNVLTKDSGGALDHIHFGAEGEISFKALLYVPKQAAFDQYDKYYGKSNALKLYVRKVLISDEFEDFMPRYLNFIKGVVDSDDLPLNVSRETLSKSRVLKVMGKKLTRKALEMLRKLAEADEKKDDDEDEDEEDEEQAEKDADEEEKKDKDEKKDSDGDEEEKEKEKKPKKYLEFWKQFGKSIKLGVIEDSRNKSKLQKLLRFYTSRSEDEPVSLETYVERMKEGQKSIYYITGETMESVKTSPFVERLLKRGFEVVYMVDALDEYVVQNMADFDGKKLVSVTKEGLKLDDETEEEKAREKALKAEFKDFAEWLQGIYGDKVEKVVVSNRVTDSPSVLVTSQYGWSANMERIMRAQTFADPEKAKYMMSKKTMEINPNHPIIKELKQRSEADADDAKARELATLMFDASLLQSGFSIDDTAAFAKNINRVISMGLELNPDAKVEDYVLPEKTEDEEEEEEEAEEAEDDVAAAEDKDEL